ncbi:epoxide hydrolase [Vandammella animalimorsus]|uniref:Epoxide hydrolase n=2 Tax=Vandammella animalimorsus TaxID=2029117 RepID=A0A2A2T7Q4_9BURK|nr:epoxide hydrolase [Vandammella animalimorsus]PAX20080.1 epoxide hydrolase [Vandammella animalimorsus]
MASAGNGRAACHDQPERTAMTAERLPPYPDMPAAHTIDANGARFSVHVAGAGLPIVLLHGFPELAYSWRHQIEPLVQAGCQVIVPDLRGYGHTGAQGALEDYRMHNLARDVLGMLDALGIAQAVVVGHDFGGALAWTLARDHAERLLGVIALNTPYTRRTEDDLIATLRKYRGEQHYMVFFQKPGQGEELLGRDVAATFSGMMRRPNPAAIAEMARQQPELLRALPATLLGHTPQLWGEPLLSQDELAVYVHTYKATGFTGGLNWYRNLHRNWLDSAGTPDMVQLPALMLTAEYDLVLPPATAQDITRNVPRAQTELIRNCGHWSQQEQPVRVNQHIIDWLRGCGLLPAS